MEEEWNQLQVGDDKTVQWGFQRDAGFFVVVIRHNQLHSSRRGHVGDYTVYRSRLSAEQRKHIEVREQSSLRKSGLQPLTGVTHRDSTLRAEGVTAKMQEDEERVRVDISRSFLPYPFS
tara:strand:- start:1029 stop:1385 length:357 start_codon:yes stop_codon:yes gene_type:complete